MFTEKNVLVIIEPQTDHQPALEQAIEIAKTTGAKITAFLNIYDFSSEIDAAIAGTFLHNAKRCTLDRQREWLDSLLSKYHQKDIKIQAVVEWNKRLHQALIAELHQHKYDCVLKTAHHHAILKRVFFTPDDWHLIRACPLPLFLIQQKTAAISKILVSIDLTDIIKDDERKALNHKLIQEGKEISEIFNSALYLIHAYPSIPALMNTTPDLVSPSEFQTELKAYREAALFQLADQQSIDSAKALIGEGPIELVVANAADEIFADLIIIGTHARQGASGFFIGNTAEALLEQTTRNLLVIPSKK